MQSIPIQNRAFKLWECRVTHGFSAFRSPMTGGKETNIDIICYSVEYLAVPTFIENITIMEATQEEIKNMEDLLGKPMDNSETLKLSMYSKEKIVDYKSILDKHIRPPNSILILESRGKHFPIVLSSYKIVEHQKDITHNPFQDYFSGWP